MNYRILLGAIVGFLIVAAARPALAITDSDKEAIRALANEAAQDYDKGHFEEAREKFLRAYAIAKVPRLALRAGRASAKLGHLVAAYELYRQAIALERNDLWLGNTQQQAQEEAKQELANLQPRLPKLTITVQGTNSADVRVSLDGEIVPSALLGIARFADPGPRKVVGTLGDQELRETVLLTEAEKKQVVLKFDGSADPARKSAPSLGAAAVESNAAARDAQTAPASGGATNALPQSDAAPKTSTPRTLGWIMSGVGAGGLVVGAVAGAVVASKYGNLNKNCANHECDASYDADVSSYQRWKGISTVGFIVGGIATVAGITLILTSPKAETAPSVALTVGPAWAHIHGEF